MNLWKFTLFSICMKLLDQFMASMLATLNDVLCKVYKITAMFYMMLKDSKFFCSFVDSPKFTTTKAIQNVC